MPWLQAKTRQAGHVNVPALTDKVYAVATNGTNINNRQAVHAISLFNEMSVVLQTICLFNVPTLIANIFAIATSQDNSGRPSQCACL